MFTEEIPLSCQTLASFRVEILRACGSGRSGWQHHNTQADKIAAMRSIDSGWVRDCGLEEHIAFTN
jgi:hypothetical protein